MSKLELKDIACYLPYKLKVFYPMTYVRVVDDYPRLMENGSKTRVLQPRNFGNTWSGVLKFKPILKPLADFTDGEWLEVFQAGYKYNLDEISYFTKGVQAYSECGFYTVFRMDTLSFESDENSFNQHKAFQMIYEKMGDVNNLIKQDLAIDIKELK